MELTHLRMPVEIGSSLDDLAEWLSTTGLTRQEEQGTTTKIGGPGARSAKKNRAELRTIKRRYGRAFGGELERTKQLSHASGMKCVIHSCYCGSSTL